MGSLSTPLSVDRRWGVLPAGQVGVGEALPQLFSEGWQAASDAILFIQLLMYMFCIDMLQKIHSCEAVDVFPAAATQCCFFPHGGGWP